MTTTPNVPAPTGALQMVRAEVNVRDFQRWMGTRRLQDPDHAMHCLLTGVLRRPRPQAIPPDGNAWRLHRLPLWIWPCRCRRLARGRRGMRGPPAIPHPACRRDGQQGDALGVPGRQKPGFRGPQSPHSSSRKGHLTNSSPTCSAPSRKADYAPARNATLSCTRPSGTPEKGGMTRTPGNRCTPNGCQLSSAGGEGQPSNSTRSS